jgi:hypothetical protein
MKKTRKRLKHKLLQKRLIKQNPKRSANKLMKKKPRSRLKQKLQKSPQRNLFMI